MSALTQISMMAPIFPIAEDTPISLRAISPKGVSPRLRTRNITFNALDFARTEDRWHMFAQEAVRLNDQGYNVYMVLNPIKPSFGGDMQNELAVCDEHVAYRHCLLIDLDRTGVLDAPATDSEIEEAGEVADRIARYLLDEHAATTYRVMSGNGMHLYLPLDSLPNDETSKVRCSMLLRSLARRFDTETIKVDTSVFNAARITKVPGTIARKGVESADRPFRMARVL